MCVCSINTCDVSVGTVGFTDSSMWCFSDPVPVGCTYPKHECVFESVCRCVPQ